MPRINRKEAIELLKSGDFTVCYYDSGACTIHRGRYESYDDLAQTEMDSSEIRNFDSSDREGYTPAEVALLVEALGGKAVTI